MLNFLQKPEIIFIHFSRSMESISNNVNTSTVFLVYIYGSGDDKCDAGIWSAFECQTDIPLCSMS